MKQIIDIADRQEVFTIADDKLIKLRSGFKALSFDYGFHIENTWGGNHKIFELQDNVEYRFFSSLFHCQLLLQQHYNIEKNIKDAIVNEPDRYTKLIYPTKHPDFGYFERQVSAIFDSVVFHLSSIFDYISILINYISIPDKDQTPQWKVLSKSARDVKNLFSKKTISQVIDKLDRDFVIKLYDYRSDLIHRKSDISEYSVESNFGLKELKIRFICSEKVRKVFKMYGEKESDYTISHFSFWLIDKTTYAIAEILSALKGEVEKNSKFPFHTFKDGSKPFVTYVDSETNTAKSPSTPHWKIFEDYYNGA